MPIKIPIAISKETNKIVNVKDVPNGLDCKCYCDKCKENLIAVNQEIVQKAHFRHANNSNCEFNNNYESYIHWLTKEVFKNIGAIYLPQIKSSDLEIETRQNLSQLITEFLRENGILDLINTDHLDEMEVHPLLYPGNILLEDVKKINIEKCTTEKIFKTKYGDIKVDIVIFSGGNKLFIEPFFTSKIDDTKKQKIANTETGTVSINLIDFITKHQYLFTIEEFKDFLTTDLISKKWVYIRDSKTKILIDNLFAKGLKRITRLKSTLISNDVINNQIFENLNKIRLLYEENDKLNQALKKVDINDLFSK